MTINYNYYTYYWFIDWLHHWLIGWLIDWLFDWLFDSLVDWLIDWLIGWIDWLIGLLIDWLIELNWTDLNWNGIELELNWNWIEFNWIDLNWLIDWLDGLIDWLDWLIDWLEITSDLVIKHSYGKCKLLYIDGKYHLWEIPMCKWSDLPTNLMVVFRYDVRLPEAVDILSCSIVLWSYCKYRGTCTGNWLKTSPGRHFVVSGCLQLTPKFSAYIHYLRDETK
jgi:hypothetical protein